MKKPVLSLCLTLLILFSIYGVVSFSTSKTQSQPMLQNKPVGCDKERTAWATCGPPFAASKKSDKYHCGECPNVKKTKPENLIWFSTSQEACNAGYSPCSVCNPPGCNRLPSPTTTITKIPAVTFIQVRSTGVTFI